MKVTVFLNQLGLGGTEKAAARWARGLAERGHHLHVLALKDGPRRSDFETQGIEVQIVPAEATKVRDQLQAFHPEIIHTHAPGHPHPGDVLGEALASLPKIPVLQTNVFGQLLNSKEDAWTDFRLFVSWTSCVQAARRTFRKLDGAFFCKHSVAVNPLDPSEMPSLKSIDEFRAAHGVGGGDILFGRLSRPDPGKWTNLSLEAFRLAARQNEKIKLLLREAPVAVAESLRDAPDRDRFVLLPATSDETELRLTMASLDVVLHTSAIGESFGYGIAEPMTLARPIIANSTPWSDQAQIELVRDNLCGFIASTPAAIADKILLLAEDKALRVRLGMAGREHIQKLADPNESLNRLEGALQATMIGQTNPRMDEDLATAKATAAYLDERQFGRTWQEQFALRPFHYRVRFHQLRHKILGRSWPAKS